MKRIAVRSEWALPLIIGVFAYFLVVGPRALYPTNIAWLAQGDPSTYFLGWQFFRGSEWSFPIGLNPRYGIELSSAIIFSDSNPLFAIFFKLFSPLLSEPFQYFGLWLLVCLVLQSWFGWKLVGLLSDSVAIRFLGAGFFAFAPPMVSRLYMHLNLAGHFLILAALYLALCTRLEKRWLSWGILLAVTAAVHAYLLAMVGLLWLADLAGRVKSGERTVRETSGELAALTIVVALVCWQAGYFTINDSGGAWGYGFYRMNLLSIFDSDNWSYLLTDLPGGDGDYEGFNYLGLGGIALLLFALRSLLGRRVELGVIIRARPFLLMALIGLTLFAISNKVAFGSLGFEIPLDRFSLRVANTFRSSGRMFWPVFYAIILASLYLTVRGNKKKHAIGILGVALCVQITDTSAGWIAIRRGLMIEPSSVWSSPLKDPFWRDAGSRYANIKWLPPTSLSLHWKELSSYAANHGLSTNAVYLARIEQSKLNRARNSAWESLNSGRYDPDTLYVLADELLYAAVNNLDSDSDLLARIDGLNVLAPRWKNCSGCPIVDAEIRLGDALDLLSPLNSGEKIDFAESSAGGKYLQGGWSHQESWGIWSDSAVAEIVVPLSFRNPARILIEADALVSSSHPKQDVELWVNGVSAKSIRLSAWKANRIEVPISDAARERLGESNLLHLRFRFPDAVRPMDIGVSGDSRHLALGLRSLTVF